MKPTVLFVCLHGSAKSVIAAEHLRRLAAARGVAVEARSAGLEPDAVVPPRVAQGLLVDGIDVREFRPRRPTSADVEQATTVVTFACDLGGLAHGARRLERWDDVPAVSEDFTRARDAIVARVTTLLDEVAGRR
jgi:arsenate reductase (thioredoxin)